jgi:hypothetical protein
MAGAADATFQFKTFKVIAVGRDDGLADKAGGFVDGETRGLHVSLKIGTGFQGAALACEDVALDRSLNSDEARFDVASHFAVGANGQRPSGCDRSGDFAFDDQLAAAHHVAFDGDVTGQSVGSGVVIRSSVRGEAGSWVRSKHI